MYPPAQLQLRLSQKKPNQNSQVRVGNCPSGFLLAEKCTNSEGKLKTPQPTPEPQSSKSPSRNTRTPRRVATQPKILEAVDDSLGPLGPLGDDSPPLLSEPGQPPAPPSKEQSLPIRNARQASFTQQTFNTRSVIDPDDLGNEGKSTPPRARFPSQGQSSPAGTENPRRQTQPSVSIEQAARPSFDITVGDPHKVGDLTSSHIVYQVRTKV